MNEPAAYLLDTNVVSEMMRPKPDQRVANAIQLAALDGIGIATVSVWEILNGIGRLDTGHRRSDLLSRFQSVLDEAFDGRVLDWTLADAQACADIMEAKRRLGEPLDDHLPDAMIAAVAVTRGLTVLTQNEAEFRNTGAAWVNPWTGLTGLVRQALTGTRISMGRAADSPGPQRFGARFPRGCECSRKRTRALAQNRTLSSGRAGATNSLSSTPNALARRCRDLARSTAAPV